jgi:hypothetical protein
MHKSGGTDKDGELYEGEVKGNDAVPIGVTKIDAGEKDREVSEIAEATFAELVSVTSELRLRNSCEDIMAVRMTLF